MILGVDPWIRKLGYALIKPDLEIVDAGILLLDEKFPNREASFKRMLEIYKFFYKLIKLNKIKSISIEKLFFTKFNQSNAEFVYGVRGILIMLGIQNNINIFEYTPMQLKKYVTANGKAEKILVQKRVMKLFGLKELPKPADVADALGLARIVSKKVLKN